MNFSRFLDIQSCWEVPSIAYFCSLFRTAFNLLDFDIEELEEALLTDGTEETASSLLTELIVRLLNGCLGNNDISAFNYQMYLRRLFRRKCQETGRYNPFNTDIDFQFLPIRTKVEILYALCDFRLDADDVYDLFKNLEAESLRVEPLGYDDNDSAYWYFYGTRLYREDIIRKPKGKNKKKKGRESKKRGLFYGDAWLDDDETERIWQVVCFTEEDWIHLTEKFSKATSKVEKELYRSLSQNFLPEIPRLFQEKERLQRKRLLELAPRRTSNRVLQKIKQKEEETKQVVSDVKEEEKEEDDESKPTLQAARESRAKRRNLLRTQSESSDFSESSESAKEEMPQKVSKRSKSQEKRSKNSSATHKGEPPPEVLVKTGRKTNNSLASVTGQILIPDNDEPSVNSTRKKLKTSQIFSQTEEDVQTDMYKVLEQLTAHEDAWPFLDPVEEKYAPNYYTVIRRPMDLKKMEERLDSGYYTDFSMFKADFKLIVNNCRLYNGHDNEYTLMVDNLQSAFDRLTEKYIHRLSSSDEEIAVEYQLPTPSRKHKLKSSESPSRHKRKKRKSHSDNGEPKSSSPDAVNEEKHDDSHGKDKNIKESHKNKEGKEKKKRKGHRHGKHSKNHKKESKHKSQNDETIKSKHSKKQKHSKERSEKKSKIKKKKNKHLEEPGKMLKRSSSKESIESSNRSRSASPLPSIHTLTPSPTEFDQPELLSDPDFYKDKYDKIKERRRNAAKDAWESLFDYKQKSIDKQKQNLNIPIKDKNQQLRETIEKLKAKSEKYKDNTVMNNFFGQSNLGKNRTTTKTHEASIVDKDDFDFSEEDSRTMQRGKAGNKKGTKKSTAKNESASEALEQAVKDISKWLDDAPKSSAVSSPCDSPAQTISTEEHDNSRLDDEFPLGDKNSLNRKEASRKRTSSREPKLLKRREVQRTIDRLQPGKSKGNLLVNKAAEKVEEVAPLNPLTKIREVIKSDEGSPKLSLGSVLPTVEFTLGNDHNFIESETKAVEVKPDASKPDVEKADNTKATVVEPKPDSPAKPNKKDAEVETEPSLPPPKLSQEKATPNLSAWFKAFGAPKSTASTTSTTKKKVEETDAEEKNVTDNDSKVTSPKTTTKLDSPADPETPNLEGGDSPLPSISATPRQRRTSTGSSVSERSSFSQDLDSPRHQMSHTSPLLRSPASPRTDDFQKITYPIINGTVRAGFYQDTTSIKSSPEKSCSPREGPQSPYSPYSQHVYASNSGMGSTTPNYFADHNKSPVPTYSQNPPPFYDSSKAPVVSKPTRVHDDYTLLGPDSYPPNLQPISPIGSSYQQNSSTYSQPQESPDASDIASKVTTQVMPDPKSALFPVKKRSYAETELLTLALKKTPELKESTEVNKNEYTKATPSKPSTSVDDIAAALSEKSEMAKLNTLRDKVSLEYSEKHVQNRISNNIYENENLNERKISKDQDSTKAVVIGTKDNVDMVNMGYENDRRNSDENNDLEFANNRENLRSSANKQQKVFETESLAINLGISNTQIQKNMPKTNSNNTNIPPAHSQERPQNEINLNQSVPIAHHNQYEATSSPSISNFSLSDIELANKKLYSCNTPSSSTAIDYGNWKLSSQARKQDILPSDYSSTYNSNSMEKLKSDLNSGSTSAINYNKSLQQQYSNYNAARSSIQRSQELQQNLTSELRIPNPRGMMKNDHMSIASSITENEMIAKSIDSLAKSQKTDKLVQNHPLVNSPYNTPYSSHSSLPLDSLRNLPNMSQMLERAYTSNERYLSSFASSTSSLYDKTFQMAQMYKTMPSEVHPVTTSIGMYSQPSTAITKLSPSVSNTQIDKTKNKRKRTEPKTPQSIGTQSYLSSPSCNADASTTSKPSMVPGSAFNFGASSNMSLGSGLYGDNGGFTTNHLMAANYMAAAVAHQQQQQQQRNTAEANTEKMAKPAHQNSSHTTNSFPFIGHSQVRAGYPFADSSSPLYQQYLQRHQEEILRQTGAQIMGLYQPSYPTGLGGRQPYDSINSINRPSWL